MPKNPFKSSFTSLPYHVTYNLSLHSLYLPVSLLYIPSSLSDPTVDRNYKSVSKTSLSRGTVGANTPTECPLHDKGSNLRFIGRLPLLSCFKTV